MTLTQAQKIAFKADAALNNNTIINAADNQPIAIKLVIPNTATDTGDNMQRVADWYNLATASSYAWQFTRGRMDNRRSILNVAGAANQLDNLTGGKRDSLLWLLDDTVEPRFSAIRSSVDDLTGTQNTLKNAILDGFKRLLTNLEKTLRIVDAQAGTFAAPYNGGFEGSISGPQVYDALLNG